MQVTDAVNWSTLSDADKLVLKSLGIVEPEAKKEKSKPSKNPITVERRLSTRNTAPEPYNVKIFDSCSCCKSKQTIIGKMDKRKLSDNFLSLIIQEIPEGEVFRQLKTVSVNCSKCDEILGQMTVEELVVMVKALHEVNAKKLFA